MNSRLGTETLQQLDELLAITLPANQIKVFCQQAESLYGDIDKKHHALVSNTFLHIIAIIVANNHLLNSRDNENWLEYFYTRLQKLGYAREHADKLLDKLYQLPIVDREFLKSIDINDTVDWNLANKSVNRLLNRNSFFQAKDDIQVPAFHQEPLEQKGPEV